MDVRANMDSWMETDPGVRSPEQGLQYWVCTLCYIITINQLALGLHSKKTAHSPTNVNGTNNHISSQNGLCQTDEEEGGEEEGG